MEQWKKHLLVMWIAQFTAMSAIVALISFIPLYIGHLGVHGTAETAMWSGIIIAVSPFFGMLGGPLWGVMSDRYGRKVMVMRVMFANSVVLTSMALAENVYQLAGLRAVQGIFGGIGAAAMALVTSLTPPEKLGFSLGIFQSAMIVGGAAGPLIGGLIADRFGYLPVFFMLGGLSLVAGIIVHFYIHEDFVPPTHREKISIGKLIKDALSDKTLLKLCAVLFICQFGMQVVGPIVPLFVHELGVTDGMLATTAGLIVAVTGLTSALSSSLSGRLNTLVSFKNILFFACLGAAICYVLQALVHSVSQLLIMRTLIGFFLGAMLPAVNSMIALLVPEEQRGTAYGVSNSANMLGLMAGPIVGGLFASSLGLRSVFWATSVIFVLAALWIRLRFTIKQENKT